MRINIKTNVDKFLNDFQETVRAFEPEFEVDNDSNNLLYICCKNEGTHYSVEVYLNGLLQTAETKDSVQSTSEIIELRHYKRFAKKTLYKVLSRISGIELPYGSLTGIRPTKLYYDLENEGFNPVEELSDYYMVSSKKLELITGIIDTQKGIYGYGTGYDAFANIPVCPTRCAYCSFLADTVSHSKKYLPEYADNLARDIATQFDMNLGKRRSIYVGGGTPTSIPDNLLAKILSSFKANGEEFTVEAGRPETLTENNVKILKDMGVTRISVNPQTFKEETLRKIGRAHTLADIYRAYELADKYGFDINMDLIAMLPDESVSDFANSVDKAIALNPANITVHTLSIKRGSKLNEEGVKSATGGFVAEMVDYAYNALTNAGYNPYYMYRQKHTCGRLENVGYAKKGKACIYNIDMMEETHTIHASGAGAISKKVYPPSDCGEVRIERLSEYKEIKGFNERIEEIIDKKYKFFDEYHKK